MEEYAYNTILCMSTYMHTHTCTHTHRFDYNLKVTICDLSKAHIVYLAIIFAIILNGFRLIYKYSKTQIPTAVHLFPLKFSDIIDVMLSFSDLTPHSQKHPII